MNKTPPDMVTKNALSMAKRCPKLLWHFVHEPRKMPKLDKLSQWQKDQSDKLVVLARDYFPGGVCIEKNTPSEAIEATEKAMANDVPAIFNATFIHKGLLLSVDVLERNKDGSWNLIVIKVASKLKHQFIPDIALNQWVLFGARVNVKKSLLMVVNNKYIRQEKIDSKEMFYLIDVTTKLKNNGPRETDIDKAVALANLDSPPTVETGSHCKHPTTCLYMDLCHKGYVASKPEPSVQFKGKFKDKVYPTDHVYSLGKRKGKILVGKGVKLLKDIPASFKLDQLEKIKQKVGITNEPYINIDSITQKLSTLTYPIYFLDFELFAPLIPAYKNTSPYGAIPFQHCLWIKESPTAVATCLINHIHNERSSDPRPDVIKTLIENLGDNGSIVAYSIDNEESVLRKLAEFSPENKNKLNNLADRLWDLAPIFNNDYIHPEFRGRFSIKVVLPALVPELSFAGLDIDDGRIACDSWEAWHADAYEGNVERLHDDLLKYCSLDVEAMVKLLEVVRLATIGTG